MKKSIKVVIIGVIATIVLFTLLFSTGTFSKLVSFIRGNAYSDTAVPVFVLNNGEKKTLNNENSEVEYSFDICNFNGSNRTETDLKYYIEIMPENLDNYLSFELYNSNNEKVNLNGQKTDLIQMKYNQNITHSYRLIVKYDSTNSNLTTDIQENIYIKAVAVQG